VIVFFRAWTIGKNIVLSAINGLVENEADCDTIVVEEDYNVHIIKEDGLITHFGLNLFSDEVKKSIGKDILNRLETELLKMSVAEVVEDIPVKLLYGDLKNLKNISPETSYTIMNTSSRDLVVEWTGENWKLKVLMPLSYQIIKGGSRTDIENLFISNIKKCEKQRSENIVDLESVVPYGDDKYIIPGLSYQNKNITRNIYLTSDSVVNPIWDSNFPLESIANLFICPNDIYGDIELNATVLKHEYGEQDKFTVPLDSFLAYCEEEGCVPFWGVEKLSNDKIEGVLLLYNRGQGYDHVLKIDCIPHEVIEGYGSITARASLFVPTSNVYNLFQPYIKKTDKEKIRYDK
jgi:hypothetical protein